MLPLAFAPDSLATGGIALAASGMFLLTVVILTLAFGVRLPWRRSQGAGRFWRFYAINDRLYHNADKKRLAWSQERFRHHRFRWQSDP